MNASGRRRRWPLIVLVVLIWLAVLALGLAWLLQSGHVESGELPLHLIVNGRDLLGNVDFARFGFGHLLGAAFALLIVLPVLLGVLGLGLLFGLAIPLLVLGALFAVLLLPLAFALLPVALLVLLLWRALRPRRGHRDAR